MTQAVANQSPAVRPERLIELREKAGLSQRELAKVIGIDPSVPRLWEKGARTMPARWVPAVAEALGVSPDDLTSAPELSDDDEWAAVIAEAEARERGDDEVGGSGTGRPLQFDPYAAAGMQPVQSQDEQPPVVPSDANGHTVTVEHVTSADILATYELTPDEIGLESTDPPKVLPKPKRVRRSKAEVEAIQDQIDLTEASGESRLGSSKRTRLEWGPGHAKLTEAQVIEIRHRFSTSRISQSDLAHEFGVSQGAISLIVRRLNWPNVPKTNGQDEDESSAAMARSQHQYGVHTTKGELLTTHEAGIRLGREHSRVRRFCEEGRMPGAILKAQGAAKKGGLWLIPDWGVKKFATLQRPNGYPHGRPRGPRPPRKPRAT